jgi:hypothetical protein
LARGCFLREAAPLFLKGVLTGKQENVKVWGSAGLGVFFNRRTAEQENRKM